MNPYKVRHPKLNPEKKVAASELKNFKKTDGDTKKVEETVIVSAISGKPYLKEDWIDFVYRIFLAICILYYTVDTIIKLYEMNYPRDLFDGCKMGFFIHHIVTIMGFKSIFIVDHYTWFLTGPMAFHTVVVGFPQYGLINNIVYLFFVSAWLYCCTRKPFWNNKACRICFFTSLFLLFPLAFLAWGNCMQEFDWNG